MLFVAKKIAIIGGTILPITSDPIENGVILVENGKIAKIGKNVDIPDNAEVIEAKGKYILPGFIDAHTHQGIWQDSVGWEGRDFNEMTDPATPHLRAIDAIYPEDRGLADGPEGGVTAINTGPGSANVIGGIFAVIKTHGKTIDDLVVKPDAALKVAFGENPKRVYNEQKKAPTTRMAVAAVFREQFTEAKNYMAKWEHYKKQIEKGEDVAPPEINLKMETLVKVLKKEMPIHAHAHRADDIITAIRLAEEFDINIALIHATEGHLIPEYLAKKKVPCIVGPNLIGREKVELKNVTFDTPGVLEKHGVKIALQSDTIPPLRYFQLIPLLAVKYGMDEKEALKAVTINPAEILGIADRMGSLEPGKDADIVIWTDHPLEFKARVEKTFINGEKVFELKKA